MTNNKRRPNTDKEDTLKLEAPSVVASSAAAKSIVQNIIEGVLPNVWVEPNGNHVITASGRLLKYGIEIIDPNMVAQYGTYVSNAGSILSNSVQPLIIISESGYNFWQGDTAKGLSSALGGGAAWAASYLGATKCAVLTPLSGPAGPLVCIALLSFASNVGTRVLVGNIFSHDKVVARKDLVNKFLDQYGLKKNLIAEENFFEKTLLLTKDKEIGEGNDKLHELGDIMFSRESVKKSGLNDEYCSVIENLRFKDNRATNNQKLVYKAKQICRESQNKDTKTDYNMMTADEKYVPKIQTNQVLIEEIINNNHDNNQKYRVGDNENYLEAEKIYQLSLKYPWLKKEIFKLDENYISGEVEEGLNSLINFKNNCCMLASKIILLDKVELKISGFMDSHKTDESRLTILGYVVEDYCYAPHEL